MVASGSGAVRGPLHSQAFPSTALGRTRPTPLMCGIAGVIDFSRARDSRLHLSPEGLLSGRDVVERMVARLRHRGPDACGIELVGGDPSAVSLGHARLAILDLSPAGRQPMCDAETGNWITCNGEVYNYRELRQVLSSSPTPWTSRTDTEVVLRAYARWGKDCLDHLDGMFAFAIWDAATEGAVSGTRPAGHQAALLLRWRRLRSLCVGSASASGQWTGSSTSGSGGRLAVSDLPVDSCAADPVARGSCSSAGLVADRGSQREGL